MTRVIPLYLGGITGNCFLLEDGGAFVLVDTGRRAKRKRLERFLAEAMPDLKALKLVVLTHGDFDHTGNAAWLQRHHRVPVALHSNDLGMVEKNDMFHGRKSGNRFLGWVFKSLLGVETFTPQVALEDGLELGGYGIGASILHLPGHSSGSIGVLTSDGDLICGDLFENYKRPRLGAIIDDAAQAAASVAALRERGVGRVFPGHGRAFRMSELPAAAETKSASG